MNGDGAEVFFGPVLDSELADVVRRRQVHARRDGTPDAAPAGVNDVCHDLCGLALSGGGIRSATFSLGVLQALERRGVLRVFDYLSTVSGGGFTGGWWSAWLCRRERDTLFPPGEEIDAQRAAGYVAPPTALAPMTMSERLVTGTKVGESGLSAGTDPIHHLRLFSNYLTPRKGMLSVDFWRAIAVVSRNLMTTWFVLVPVLLVAVLLGQILLFMLQESEHSAGRRNATYAAHPFFVTRAPAPPQPPSPPAGGVFLSDRQRSQTAEAYDTYLAAKATHDAAAGRHRRVLVSRLGLAGIIVGGVWLMGFLNGVAWFLSLEIEHGRPWFWFSVAVLATAVVLAGLAAVQGTTTVGTWSWPSWSPRRWVWVGLAVSAAVILPTWRAVAAWRAGRAAARRTAADGTVTYDPGVQVAVQGNQLVREHARWLIALVFVTGAITLSWFGHEVIDYLRDTGRTTLLDYVARAGGWLAVAAAVLGAAFTAFKAAPVGGHDTSAARPPWATNRIVFGVAPPLFLVVLTMACAWATRHVLMALQPSTGLRTLVYGAVLGAFVALVIAAIEAREGHLVRAVSLTAGVAVFAFALVALHYLGGPTWIVVTMAVALLVAILGWIVMLGWMIDPNAVSLHLFYRARLVRAYLGASNDKRHGRRVEVTEAVDGDDIPLAAVDTCGQGGPYHVINTTLNLVGGRDLTTAQRSAAAFTFSRTHCGSTRTGYRPTARYMDGDLTLGTVVAISGAAASPNMGAVSPTAAQAMLMTLFNVRLGYWLPTPNDQDWESPRARLWPYYVLQEFLSQTNDTTTYCYVTDGGHFDNTALYSLVERGCRFIVLVDNGADPDPCFEDVGTAIRRCRIDFGAEIDFDVDGFLPEKGTKRARRHFALGTIRYAEAHARALGWPEAVVDTPAQRTGVIVWLKPSLNADEPADVRQYALQTDAFPQHPTVDQWFGESQFESYRRLGQFTVEQVFDDVTALALPELRARLLATPPDPTSRAHVRVTGRA